MKEILSLREAIEFAIKTEEIGLEFYTNMSDLFAEQEELKDMFTQLAKDESKHKIEFKEILETIPENNDSEGEVNAYLFLRAIANFEMFKKDTWKTWGEIKSKEDILLKALAFEKGTYQYHCSLKDLLGESPQLDEIIEAEKRHIVRLQTIRTNGV